MQCAHCTGLVCAVHRGRTRQVRLAKDTPQESRVGARRVRCYSEGSGGHHRRTLKREKG